MSDWSVLPTTVIARNAAGCEITEPVSLVNPDKYTADFNINPLPTTTRDTRVTFQDISLPGPVANSLFTIGKNPVIGEAEFRISTFEFPKDTSGTYPVTLLSRNVNGCTDTITKQVIIKDDLLWYIPNSFSPNEDGINDVWKIKGNTVDITDFQLTIIDRWGRIVFATQDIDQGWNGSVEGSEYYADINVYSYLIKVVSSTTEDKFELTGSITVVR